MKNNQRNQWLENSRQAESYKRKFLKMLILKTHPWKEHTWGGLLFRRKPTASNSFVSIWRWPSLWSILKTINIITRTPNKNIKDFIFRKGKITKLLTAHEVEQRDGFKKRNVKRKKLDLHSYINSSAKYDILGTGNKKCRQIL